MKSPGVAASAKDWFQVRSFPHIGRPRLHPSRLAQGDCSSSSRSSDPFPTGPGAALPDEAAAAVFKQAPAASPASQQYRKRTPIPPGLPWLPAPAGNGSGKSQGQWEWNQLSCEPPTLGLICAVAWLPVYGSYAHFALLQTLRIM